MAHILIVDDDADIRTALRLVLEDEGHTVEEASSGQPALERLRTSSVGLVVLLDVTMPGVDGYAVIRAVAAHPTLATRHAYVVLTACAVQTLPPAFVHHLAQMRVPLLGKPVDVDELLDAVAQADTRLEHKLETASSISGG
jgi:CheY-like chemotaxis protein